MSAPGQGLERALSRRSFVKAGAAAAAGLTLGVPRLAAARRGTTAELVLRNGRVHTLAGTRAPAGGRDRGRQDRLRRLERRSGGARRPGDRGDRRSAARIVMPGIHDGHIAPALGRPRAHGADAQLPPAQPAAVHRRDPQAARSLGRRGARRLALGRSLGRHRDGQAADQGGPRRAPDLDGRSSSLARRPHRARQLARARDRRRSTPRPPTRPAARSAADRGNEPTGILLDTAIGLVASLIPPPTPEQNAERARGRLLGVMAEQGVTCLHEVSAGRGGARARWHCSPTGAGSPLRPHVAIYGDASWREDPAAMLAHVEQLRSHLRAPRPRDRHLKLFFDGVIEYPTQTAALLRALPGQQGHQGGPEVGRRQGPRPDLLAAARSPTRRSRPPTRPAGRSTCTRSATARCARRSTPSSTHAASTGRPTTGTRSTHLELVDPEDFRRFARARRAREHADAVGRARQLHRRPPPRLPRPEALAPRLPGRQPAASRRDALRRQRLAGRPAAARSARSRWRSTAPPTRSTRATRSRCSPARASEAAVLDRDAHPQQRLPAAPGGPQRADQ